VGIGIAIAPPVGSSLAGARPCTPLVIASLRGPPIDLFLIVFAAACGQLCSASHPDSARYASLSSLINKARHGVRARRCQEGYGTGDQLHFRRQWPVSQEPRQPVFASAFLVRRLAVALLSPRDSDHQDTGSRRTTEPNPFERELKNLSLRETSSVVPLFAPPLVVDCAQGFVTEQAMGI